jgi:hypothetical protein
MLEEREMPTPRDKVWSILSNLDRALILAWNEIYQKYGAMPEAFDLVVKVSTLSI